MDDDDEKLISSMWRRGIVSKVDNEWRYDGMVGRRMMVDDSVMIFEAKVWRWWYDDDKIIMNVWWWMYDDDGMRMMVDDWW